MWESIIARSTAGTLPPNDTGPAWALPTLWAAVMANGPGGVALTRQCSLVVEGHQGPGGVLTESRGCLGAVKTKTAHGIIPGGDKSQPSPSHLLCQLVFWGRGSGCEVWEEMRDYPTPGFTASDSQPSFYPSTPEHIPGPMGGNFWWLK